MVIDREMPFFSPILFGISGEERHVANSFSAADLVTLRPFPRRRHVQRHALGL